MFLAYSTKTELFSAVFGVAFALIIIGLALGFLVKRVLTWLACRYDNAPAMIVERRLNCFRSGNTLEDSSEPETASAVSAPDPVTYQKRLEVEHERHVAVR